MIQTDDSDHALIRIGNLGQLGIQQRLLSCKDFEIGRSAQLHQRLGSFNSSFQRSDLLISIYKSFLCRLNLIKSIAYLFSCIKDCLLEINSSHLLLSFGSFQIRDITAMIEYRLYKRCSRRQQHFSGINDHAPGRVGPSGRSRNYQVGIKGRPRYIRSIICRSQRELCRPYIGTNGK